MDFGNAEPGRVPSARGDRYERHLLTKKTLRSKLDLGNVSPWDGTKAHLGLAREAYGEHQDAVVGEDYGDMPLPLTIPSIAAHVSFSSGTPPFEQLSQVGLGAIPPWLESSHERTHRSSRQ